MGQNFSAVSGMSFWGLMVCFIKVVVCIYHNKMTLWRESIGISWILPEHWNFRQIFQVNTGWGIQATVYVLNRLPSRILDGKSPFELLSGREPSFTHLRVFVCLCYATNVLKEDKFVVWSRKAVLMGYSTPQKGYILYDLVTKTFFC